MKITETGVMAVNGNKAWGVKSNTCRGKKFGWINPAYAEIYSEQYYKRISDFPHDGTAERTILASGKIVKATKTTIIEFIP